MLFGSMLIMGMIIHIAFGFFEKLAKPCKIRIFKSEFFINFAPFENY